ncbi:LCP family protein [Aeromicrobium sp.]|uniref:LCP family protein n=1 Tax=Aeromicrobium sp. TaxID=1871063 RepID=UPI003D6A09F3
MGRQAGRRRATLLGRGTQDSHLDSPRVRFRRALALCAMTVVAPGSVQYTVGRRWVGATALAVWALLLVLTGFLVWKVQTDRSAVLSSLTDTDVLLAARFGVALVAVGWIALLVDAWRLAQPFSLNLARGAVIMVVNTALVVGVGASAVVASQAIDAPRQVIQEVFTATKTSEPLKGRYNILLVGSDSGPDRTGIRPDSMTVASIDADTGRTVLISLPRNLQNVPFRKDSPMSTLYPNSYNCGSECLLNAVYTAGEGRKDLYPKSKQPGLEATIDAIEGATDLTINYHVVVNLKGFRSLIDAVGGVEVDVKTRIAMFGDTTVYKQKYIEPGKQNLNGREALWFARSRYMSDDFARMGRQKCLMKYMADQLSPQKVVLNAQGIASSSKQLLRTNIPAKELGQFADLALKSRGERIATVSLVPPEVNVVTPDFAQIHRKIAKAIRKSEANGGGTSSDPDSPSPDESKNPGTEPTDGTGAAGPKDDPMDANTTDDLTDAC